MTIRVGLYVRISEDAEGLGLGVARQEHDARKAAAQRGWDIGGVYSDNDVSAYRRGVVRPSFERLLEDVASGLIDGIVTYDLDRFARKLTDLERAIDVYDVRNGKKDERDNKAVFATVQGDIDLSTSDGRFVARILVSAGNKSSMDTSRRVRDKHADMARRGQPAGSNRPFGWDQKGLLIEPTEAALIQKAAVDVLAGASLHGICREWNEMGVRTPERRLRKPGVVPKLKGGNLWRSGPLKLVLTNPRVAGWRTLHGKIAIGFQGELVRGQQEPILSEEQWQAVVAVLTDPARGGRHAHPGARKYLLSGAVRCALCSSTLRGNSQPKKNTYGYGCPSTTNGGCGKVGISGPQLDAHVTVAVLDELTHRQVDHSPTPWDREADLEAIRSQLVEMSEAYSSRQISAKTFIPLVTDLEAQENALLDERSSWLRDQVRITNTPTDAPSEWETMSDERRREVISDSLEAILVRPAVARGGRFDSSRVELVWRRTVGQSAPIVRRSSEEHLLPV